MGIKVIVDLRNQFGAVRNQGPRPTCMAFAASDAHSFARHNPEALSVEYAFYHAVNRKVNPDPNRGVSFDLMSAVISTDGQPLEVGWPYSNQPLPAHQWNPPKNPGTLFYRSSKKSAKSLASIFLSLDTGSPVMLVINVSRSVFGATGSQIVNAPVTEPRLNTHAVIAAGYGEENGAHCVLIRNSWGAGWADAGYGWLHQEYLEPRLLVAGVMD